MDNVFEKIKKDDHLPQLPHVMLKLVKACGRETTDIDELTGIISTEPALTSKLLQIISSPFVNLPKEVNTIKTAVVYLGLDTIRNIAISSSAMHFFKLSKVLPEFDITRFWYHSYKCAVLARKLAKEEGHPNAEEFFLAGLLHDIGQLVLMRSFPGAYATVMADVRDGACLADAEMARLGADTAQVSAWLFTQWRLNPISSDAVLFVNAPLDRVQGELGHVKILYLANALAEGREQIQAVLGLTGIPEIRVTQILAEAQDEADQMARRLGVSLDDPGAPSPVEREIAVEIKDSSLFFGTLTALLAANDLSAVLEAVQKGVEIVFQIPRVFFFLLDPDKKMLVGTCNPKDRHYPIVRSIAIPLDSRSSMVAGSHGEQEMKHTFALSKLAVSDAQILRLMESKGLYTVPIACRKESQGVMVLGVDKAQAASLDRNQGILRLFSAQTGVCLENLRFHESYASDVNEKKMEAFAALTDKVIHEVNNPIAIIRNYLETLCLKLPVNHPAQEELSLVGEEIQRVSSLLDGLSSFSRPKIGGLEMIDLNQTCARVLEVLKKSILLPRKIEAQAELDPGIPLIKMDGNGFKQVFINLVKNAAEAMEGGGSIQITTRLVPGSTKVMIDERKKLPGSVEIRIQDTGPGIPPQILERLFEPYNSSKSGRHSGLGLAIVRSIVKEMKGQITCQSDPGKGTCFSLFLPLIPENTGRSTHDPS